MKTATALLFAALATAVSSSGTIVPEPALVAPGVWRIRVGAPEGATPVAFRLADFQPKTAALAALPPVEKCPVDAARIFATATARGLRLEMPYEGEVIYGLGLQVKHFQQQGKLRLLMNNAAELSDLGTTHAAFPYYVSARGYAVLVDTARYTTLRIGTNTRKSPALARAKGPKTILASDDNDAAGATAEDAATDRSTKGKPILLEIPAAQGADIYVFAGPAMLDAVRRYNLWSGGGALPPLAALAPKFRMESLASQEHVLALARYFRENKLPIATIALEPGWHTHAYAATYDWNTVRYDPAVLLPALARDHFRLDLWEHPFIHPTSSHYQSLYDRSGDYAVFGGLVPDLADPEAMKIYAQIHDRLIAQTGVASFKIDANDNLFLKASRFAPFPDTTRFPSGLDGEQMHQLFGLLTQQGALRPFLDRRRRTLGETRCSGPLAAPYPYVLFSDMGDQTDYFRMMLTGGFCGLLWQPEIRRASNNTFAEYYARVQMAVLSPALTFNNYMMPFPAWFQMDPKKNKARELDPDADIAPRVKIIRALLEQRMALIPYLYAAYKNYETSGIPPFRAVVLDYPDDKNAAALDDQMLVGDALLAYTFFKPRRDHVPRRVWLPAGAAWFDYNTGERHEGGRFVTVRFDPEKIPAFVRENTLLPLAKPVEHIDADTVFDLTVRVYGDTPAERVLIEDDGESLDYKNGAQTRLVLRWTSETGGTLARTGTWRPLRYRVIAWERVGAQNAQ